MDWGASSMPGRGIQRQGREFNMPWKKEMLILRIEEKGRLPTRNGQSKELADGTRIIL
jgi:hypothetical protein